MRTSVDASCALDDWRDLMRRREQLRALEESYADEFGMIDMIADTLPELGSPTTPAKGAAASAASFSP